MTSVFYFFLHCFDPQIRRLNGNQIICESVANKYIPGLFAEFDFTCGKHTCATQLFLNSYQLVVFRYAVCT